MTVGRRPNPALVVAFSLRQEVVNCKTTPWSGSERKLTTLIVFDC